MSCPFAKKNKFGRFECTAQNYSGLCSYQKYCGKKFAWELTSDTNKCERRKK